MVRWDRLRRRGLTAILCITSAVIVLHQRVVWSAAPHLVAFDARSDEHDGMPPRTAIVLGASVHPNGTPSQMLADRLRTAAVLWSSGRVRDILITGDGGGDGYDECAVMRHELLTAGVDETAIRVDHAGFRTRASMQRAYGEFGVRAAFVVTNPFHIHRAVFLARAAGIDAIGAAAPPATPFRATTLLRHHTREFAARVLASLESF